MSFPRMFKGNVCTTAVATTCRQHYDLQWDSYVWEHSDTEFCLKLSFLDCYLIRNWLWLLHSGIARVWGFFNRLYMLFTIVKKAFNSEWPLCGNTGWIVVSLSYSQFLFQLKKKPITQNSYSLHITEEEEWNKFTESDLKKLPK